VYLNCHKIMVIYNVIMELRGAVPLMHTGTRSYNGHAVWEMLNFNKAGATMADRWAWLG
jgi:hypothetical protein